MQHAQWQRVGCLIIIALLLPATGGAQTPAVTPVASPAPEGALLPNLFQDSTRSFLLSWVERSEKGHALRFSRFAGGNWEPARTVSEGSDWFVNWADFPSVVELGSGSLAAHWLQRSSDRHYSYDVKVTLSTDGGETWRDPIVPHSDSTPTEHGFVSLVALDHELAALWLDGRQTTGRQGAMGLWFASITRRGGITAEELLDPRVCDCCQTSATPIRDGLLVAYRDRSPAEVRDISVVRMVDGRWESPRPVASDGWQIRACPVNGPALAGDGNRRVAVAWFSAAADVPRVQVAFSDNAGISFEAPIQIDAGQPLGRVHIVRLDDDKYAVSWLERRREGSTVYVRRVGPSGPLGPSVRVAEIAGGRGTGFPRMVPWADGVLVAWTRPPEEPETPADPRAEKEETDPGGVELAAVRFSR